MEENKYKAALERAKSAIKECGGNVGRIKMIESIFSDELWESEEEQTRKQLLDFVQRNTLASYSDRDKWVAWLEKQGKCETDCPQNHQDVNHPNGCITMEDFNGGEGFYKLNIEYLNKRQVEEIEEIVRTWNKDADCKLCTSKKHCISIEKQDEMDIEKPITIGKRRAVSGKLKELFDNKDPKSIEETKKKMLEETEPKFKVGDFIVNDYCMGRVVEITNDAYLLDTGQGIPFSCEHNAHLWSISDAKDGDVLAEESCIFIIQKLADNNIAAKTYCALYSDVVFEDGSILYFDIDSTKPATKEQRDKLFKVISNKGYTFDFEKKELSKLPSTEKSEQGGKWRWDEDDEKFFKENILVGLGNVDDISEELYSKIIDWLNLIKKRLS